MIAKDAQWVLTADQSVGRLLRLDRSPQGSTRIRVQDEIEESWEAHEHGRPSPLKGKGGHTHASPGHEDETRRARFAKEVAVWLEQHAEHLHVDHIAVFAPPSFMGALRDAWSPRFALIVEEHGGDLAHVPTAELARHRAVTGRRLSKNGAASPSPVRRDGATISMESRCVSAQGPARQAC